MYIIEALRKKYEGDIAVAKANVKVYMTTPAGIGDHSNVVQAVDEQVSLIANAQDKLVALKHFDQRLILLIEFKYVRWKNFLSTGNQFIEIQLDRNPTTLIIGENGAGKSTILDALCFGLFGKPFRGINKPQLLNSVNGSGCLVEIEFKIVSKFRFSVQRTYPIG